MNWSAAGRSAAASRPLRIGCILVATLSIGVVLARANPVPDEAARAMNERPARWLAHPTPEDERALIRQFANYGISRGLLSPETIDLLGRHFDRFAPLLIAAQRPPHGAHRDLQRWFRERTSLAQGESMKGVLREWLVVHLTEAPIHGSMLVTGPDEVAREILNARLDAAEALGDWRDREALPLLRGLLEKLPPRRRSRLEQATPRSIVQAAMRRITDPEHADVLVVTPDGRVEVRRPTSELDSLVIEAHDDITKTTGRWVVGDEAARRVWASLLRGREARPGEAPTDAPPESFRSGELTLYFKDGWEARMEGQAGRWEYTDNSRAWEGLWIYNPELQPALTNELQRAGIAPRMPRFVSESVTLEIVPGALEVIGHYDFEGAPENGSLEIVYPIDTGDGLGEPRIEAVTLRPTFANRQELRASYTQRGPVCRISLEPGAARQYTLEVRYRQPRSGRSAKYLITTARAWGRPLHRAWFQVIVPDSIGELHSSLPLREVPERQSRRRFLFEAAPFRPDRDLVLSW